MLKYSIGLVVILGFLFFFIRKPTVATYVKYTLYSFPFMDTPILPLEYGFFRAFDIMALIAFLILFREFITIGYHRRQNLFYFVLVGIFILFSVIGKIYSINTIENLFMGYPLFSLFVFLRFFILYLSDSFYRRYELINILKISLVISMVVIGLQMGLGTSITYYGEVHSNAQGESIGTTRFPGIFIDSQTNGQFLAMASFLFLVWRPKASINRKRWGYFGFGCMAVAVVLAGSRSALGGFLVGSLVLVLLSDLRTKITIGGLGLLAASTLFIFNPEVSIFGRTKKMGDDLDFRKAIWEETFEMVNQHPLLGIGVGNYREYIMTYHQDLNLVIEPGVEYYYFTQPENGYLKIMVEQGVIAFFIFILLILIPLASAVWGILMRKVNKEAAGIIAGIVALLIAFNTVFTFIDYRVTTMFGILVSLLILFTDKPYFNAQSTNMNNFNNIQSLSENKPRPLNVKKC